MKRVHTLTLGQQQMDEISSRSVFSGPWNYQKHDVTLGDDVTLVLEGKQTRTGKFYAVSIDHQIVVYFERRPDKYHEVTLLLTEDEYATACQMAEREIKPRHFYGNHWKRLNGDEYVQSMIQHLIRGWRKVMDENQPLPTYNNE